MGKTYRQYRVWTKKRKKQGVGDWLVDATSSSHAITKVRKSNILKGYKKGGSFLPPRKEWKAKLDKR